MTPVTRMVFQRGGSGVLDLCLGPNLSLLVFSCDGLPPQYTPSSLHSHGVSAWRVQMTPVTRMVFQRGGSGVLDLCLGPNLSLLVFSCDGLPPQYTPSSLHSHGVSAWRVQMTRSLAWCFSVAGPAFWTSPGPKSFFFGLQL